MFKFDSIMTSLLILFFLIICTTITGQNLSGIVIDETDNQPIEFVNIGIARKNVGTVSDANGKFNFFVESRFDEDTLLFSSIGYYSHFIKISDLRENLNPKVILKKKSYELAEVVIRPRRFAEKRLGVNTKFKGIAAGFKDNLLGYECGIRMKVKKTAYLKKVNINISNCSYDTLFYRLNIYKVHDKTDFENILREPVYIKMPKGSVKDEIQIDLESENIVVDGDFLVTLEHIKDLGEGYLYFCAGFSEKTYFRKTSQGIWETVPVGISISVLADVEK